MNEEINEITSLETHDFGMAKPASSTSRSWCVPAPPHAAGLQSPAGELDGVVGSGVLPNA